MSSMHKHLSILLVNTAKQLAKEDTARTARVARRSKKMQGEVNPVSNPVSDKQSNQQNNQSIPPKNHPYRTNLII